MHVYSICIRTGGGTRGSESDSNKESGIDNVSYIVKEGSLPYKEIFLLRYPGSSLLSLHVHSPLFLQLLKRIYLKGFNLQSTSHHVSQRETGRSIKRRLSLAAEAPMTSWALPIPHLAAILPFGLMFTFYTHPVNADIVQTQSNNAYSCAA